MYLIDINVVLRVNNSEKYQLCYLFYYVIPIFYFQGLRPLRAEGNVIHSLAFNATHKYRFKILFHTSPEGFKEKHSPHMSSKSYLLNRKQTIYQYITDPCCLVSIHADLYWHLALSWIRETNSWTSSQETRELNESPFLVSQGDVSYCDMPAFRARAASWRHHATINLYLLKAPL